LIPGTRPQAHSRRRVLVSVGWRFEGTVQVTVRDRKLTITNGPGALNDKIDYIDALAG